MLHSEKISRPTPINEPFKSNTSPTWRCRLKWKFDCVICPRAISAQPNSFAGCMKNFIVGCRSNSESSKTKTHIVDPGKLRESEVSVGRHMAPSSKKLDQFLNRFAEFYGPLVNTDL